MVRGSWSYLNEKKHWGNLPAYGLIQQRDQRFWQEKSLVQQIRIDNSTEHVQVSCLCFSFLSSVADHSEWNIYYSRDQSDHVNKYSVCIKYLSSDYPRHGEDNVMRSTYVGDICIMLPSLYYYEF